MGELGAQRIQAALERAKSADMVLMVSPGNRPSVPEEEMLFEKLFSNGKKVPALFVASHAQADLHPHKAVWLEKTGGLRVDSPQGKWDF